MEELINKYFGKRLSESEQKQFDQLMKDDDEFRTEVEFLTEMRDGIALSKRAELKSEMSQWDLESETVLRPQRKSKRFNLRKLAAAASFLLLAASAFYIFENQNSNNYFSPMENISHPIQRSGEPADADEAFIAYEKLFFDEADALFGKLYEESGEDYLLIYQANSKMANKDYADALPLLNTYLQQGGELDQDAEAVQTLKELELLSDYKEDEVGKLLKRLS